MTKRIVYLDEAADILGLSQEALRKRIKRGTIGAQKDATGRWQVFIEDGVQDVEGGRVQAIKDAYVQGLIEQIEDLKKDKIYFMEELAWEKMKRLQAEHRVHLLLEAPKHRRLWWPFNSAERNKKNI